MEQENKYNEFNKHFHDAFADWETKPHASVWDKVEANLEREGKKRRGAWWWFSGIVLLLIGLGTWYFWPVITNQQHASGKNAVVVAKQIESHKKDSINAAMLAIKKHDDSLASVIKTDADSMKRMLTTSAKTKSTIAKSTPVNTQYSQSTTISHTSNKTTAQYTASNYKRTDSLLSSMSVIASSKPKNASANTTKPTGFAKKGSVKATTIALFSISQKLQSQESSVQNKQPKKDNTTTQKPKVEESIAMSSQAKPAMKKKDSIVNKKDSTTSQSTTPVIAKTDSIAQKKKADSLLAIKKSPTDSVKKGSLTKASKKNASDTSQPYHVISISGFFSPELARIDVTANNSKFNAQNLSPQNKYMFGAKFGYTLNKRIQLSIGLAYSQFHQDFHSDTVSFPKAISQPFVFSSTLGDMSVPASTMLQGFSPLFPGKRYIMHYQYNQTVQFINIPITARLNILTGRLKPYIDLGINVQYAFSQGATLELLKELEVDAINYNTLEVRTLNFAASAGFGAEYAITKYFGAYIEPTARMDLQSNSTNSTVKSTNSFVGCQTGIEFQF